MLKMSKRIWSRVSGWLLILIYVLTFSFLFKYGSWAMFLFFVFGIPLAFVLKRLGFPSGRAFSATPQMTRKQMIVGAVVAYAYIALFCFWFVKADQLWQVPVFFLAGLPVALILWKVCFERR